MPRLQSLLTKRRASKRQTWQQMKSMVAAINAAFGGTVDKR